MDPSVPFDQTRVLRFQPGSYRAVLDLQRTLQQQRIAAETPDVILLGEHERVITVGRATRVPPLAQLPVIEVERGGEVTWHGPGQLVGYPIVHLRDIGIGVRDYLRRLEAALIAALGRFGIDAGRNPRGTGVWVGERKIASMGVSARHFVTCHGFALNVDADLTDFRQIQPCGFDPGVMTSMAEVLGPGEVPELGEVAQEVLMRLVAELRLAPPIWDRPWNQAAGP